MNIRTELANMNSKELYSVMLFALYKLTNIPEYSTLSELAFILDKDNLLKLCEYFGGLTIKIPTISELEIMINTLILYKDVEINKIPFNQAFKDLTNKCDCSKEVLKAYNSLSDIMTNYTIEGV